MKLGLLAAAIALLTIPVRVEGRVWTVGRGDADFPLIAPAIAAAADGDEVRVGAGVYREDLRLDRRVSIVGEGQPVLFGTGNGTVIDVRADGCEIRGLVIDGTGIGATNQMDAAVRLSSNRNAVTGNVMRRVFYGVVIAGGADNTIAGNDIEGLLDRPFGRRGDGIYVYRGSRNHVVGNRIVGQRDAIFLQYAHAGRVEGNEVTESRYGLHDMFSDDTLIRSNVFRNSLVGANLMNSRRLTLEHNEFAGNRGVTAVGLSLKDCDASSILHNRFVANARGLQLDGSSGNKFFDNDFSHNDVAVRLQASAERNTFSRNRFHQNWSDVVESGGGSTTLWSHDGTGNAWGRYAGFDFDGDGIGESAHPLLRPFERIEGTNEIARLYLQSPAAGALDLVARSAVQKDTASADPHPIAKNGSGNLFRGTPSKKVPGTVFWLTAAAVVLLLKMGSGAIFSRVTR
ncbi:MAG: nitrous oxide reductase family maturation protein NosD [Acidobacteria bacterium]|nr:MAG: nitrous oxide reductase family maturation protein NosD [Acidobacteriota bacterium]